MTYRERRLARADRLRDWSDKRATRSAASFAAAERIADGIPLGQPILVGHHSEAHARRDQDRIYNGMRAGVESAKMAESMASRAANIERAAEHAIYSDDPDAIERLKERLADLEAERERIKAYNASCRAGKSDETLLDSKQLAELNSVRRDSTYSLGKGGAFPSYHLTNLGGNIGRQRERLKALEHPAPTWFHASRRDPETCYKCDQPKSEHTPSPQVLSVLMCPAGRAA